MTGGPIGFKQSEALDTIERLDLWNELAGWEIHQLAAPTSEVPKQLRAKGCFVMFNLDEFDFSAISKETQEVSPGLGSAMDEDGDAEMQIDSSAGIKKEK